MNEATVQKLIRLEAARMGIDLWRNNNGACIDSTGRAIRYGLANESKQMNEKIKSSDLIGLMPTTAYIEGWGWVTVGIALAIECKPTGWIFSLKDERAVAQKNFHDIFRKGGGIAGFATSVEDFRRIVGR